MGANAKNWARHWLRTSQNWAAFAPGFKEVDWSARAWSRVSAWTSASTEETAERPTERASTMLISHHNRARFPLSLGSSAAPESLTLSDCHIRPELS